jgi:hypothetical protein
MSYRSAKYFLHSIYNHHKSEIIPTAKYSEDEPHTGPSISVK